VNEHPHHTPDGERDKCAASGMLLAKHKKVIAFCSYLNRLMLLEKSSFCAAASKDLSCV
jgi:hypothetical protein